MKVVRPKGYALLHKGEWIVRKKTHKIIRVAQRGIYNVSDNDFIVPVPVITAIHEANFRPHSTAEMAVMKSKKRKKLEKQAVKHPNGK